MSFGLIASSLLGSAIPALFGGGSDDEGVARPEYVDPYENEYFKKSQEELSGLGSSLLSGDIPEYYRGIGDVSGPQVTNARNLLAGTIQRKGEESAAARGLGSSPAGMAPTAQAISQGLTEFDLSTLLKSLEGKKYLLNTGVNALGTTGSQALNATGYENNFNMRQYQTEYQEPTNPYSSIAGLAGDVAGMYFNRPNTVKETPLGSANPYGGGYGGGGTIDLDYFDQLAFMN